MSGLRVAAVAVAAAAVAAPLVVSRLPKRGGPLGILDEAAMAAINGNQGLLSLEEARLVVVLLEAGQAHLFEAWPPPGKADRSKRQLLRQLLTLDRTYAGGLKAYIFNAKELLAASARGDNPFDGYTPAVPQGVSLEYGSTEFVGYEAAGLQAAATAGFVLVAGGIGERLGYNGIKVGIPTELARGVCFLELYIEHLKALQYMANLDKPRSKQVRLPLAIMTSDDTHSATLTLLRANGYFGLKRDQITLMKQEKVACFSDNNAALALEKDDPFQVQTKPHGHGDVHALLASTGTAAKWLAEGKQWICFFQDTNSLVFRGLLAALGVSHERHYDFNALAVPRKAKEAIGAISNLKHRDGSQITINVEYNQLEPLLKATVNPEGDVNDGSGFSPYPGNINQLVLSLPSYVSMLNKTGGVIGEFVNPKYADASRSVFKKSTRLECMMQDYPKGLPSDAKVGFTQLDVWAAYSPVKNHPDEARAKFKGGNPTHSATSGELDIYAANCRTLRMIGVDVAEPADATFNELTLPLWPRVSLSPAFAPAFSVAARKFERPADVHIQAGSTLVLDGANIFIKSLRLNGALVIKAAPGAKVTVDGLTVSNKGWEWKALEEGEAAEEYLQIRGFRLRCHEALRLEFPRPGIYAISDDTPRVIEKYRVGS